MFPNKKNINIEDGVALLVELWVCCVDHLFASIIDIFFYLILVDVKSIYINLSIYNNVHKHVGSKKK